MCSPIPNSNHHTRSPEVPIGRIQKDLAQGIPWKNTYTDDMKKTCALWLCVYIYIYIWLVVWDPLKNISQLGWLFPIYGKIKNVPNHQPVYIWVWLLLSILVYTYEAGKGDQRFLQTGCFYRGHDEHPINGFRTYNVGLPSCKML